MVEVVGIHSNCRPLYALPIPRTHDLATSKGAHVDRRKRELNEFSGHYIIFIQNILKSKILIYIKFNSSKI
jgi:hypothetical protein